MTKIYSLLVALIMAVSLMTLSTTAANATTPGEDPNPVICHTHKRTDSDTVRVSDFAYDHKFYLHGTVWFAVCKQAGHRTYSLPLHSRITYNRDGSSQKCKVLDWRLGPVLDYMRGNAKFVDTYDTPDFNPGEWRADCQKDTTGGKSQWYHTSTKLYWRDGHPPKWVIYWALVFKGRFTVHPHGNFSGVMKWA